LKTLKIPGISCNNAKIAKSATSFSLRTSRSSANHIAHAGFSPVAQRIFKRRTELARRAISLHIGTITILAVRCQSQMARRLSDIGSLARLPSSMTNVARIYGSVPISVDECSCCPRSFQMPLVFASNFGHAIDGNVPLHVITRNLSQLCSTLQIVFSVSPTHLKISED
jgi:hypothetical protein